MDGLTATCGSGGRFLLLSPHSTSARPKPPAAATFFVPSRRRRRSFSVSAAAASDGSELDKWDQMELKFGRLLGEDPRLTLAKVKARKSNPNASFVEIEREFYKKKKKGKSDEAVEVPLDWDIPDRNQEAKIQQRQQEEEEEEENPSSTGTELQGLRSPNRGNKKVAALDGTLKLTKPVGVDGGNVGEVAKRPAVLRVNSNADVPGVRLRKPDGIVEDDIEEKPSRFTIKPNLMLRIRKGGDGGENLSEVNLLKKPEVVKISVGDSSKKNASFGDAGSFDSDVEQVNRVTVSRSSIESSENGVEYFVSGSSEPSDGIVQNRAPPTEVDRSNTDSLDKKTVTLNIMEDASFQGKPQRSEFVSTEISEQCSIDSSTPIDRVNKDAFVEHLVSAKEKEHEDGDWTRAENLLQTGERVEVELISGSSRGFVVSFGSLIGFLPYKNVGAKWKFLAFESWLRKNGLDPSLYRQNLSIIGKYSVQNKGPHLHSEESQDKEDEKKLGPEMKFEDLLEIYDQEKTRFLSSFVGQRTRVAVAMVDRKSRKLILSGKPKEKQEVIEKKRSLMAKLSVGDIVKCYIKKITYFGIFVEIDEVPALIHQSEISWDTALDPSSIFKIGQMVDAKVHQLDFALERITLSLKEVTPDPLNEALESVIGDSVEASQGDVEWADVESLIRELEQMDGVIDVSKGRFFFSPGLAPTFQVYMASMYESRYKLLARYENKVQEVIVHASLDKDQMKAAILTCTNRVE